MYFISQEELFNREAVARLSEFSAGVHGLDFGFDAGDSVADATLSVIAERWFAPPGSVIELYDCGPANGRWLITGFRRSLFSDNAEVLLTKPEPKLPEPAPQVQSEQINLNTGQSAGVEGEGYYPATSTAIPKSSGYTTSGDPEGQGGGHRALDWFAPAGSAVFAPIDGTVFRVSPDPNPGSTAVGQVFGGSVYITGKDKRAWVFRHVQDIRVTSGQKVKRGEQIASVKKWSGPTHVHVEAYKVGAGYSYSAQIAVDPWKLYKGQTQP